MAEINQYRKDLRSKVIAYAMNEFYNRGVKAVKMDEISQGLHVSKRTLYEIFGDKEELLLAGMAAQREEERLALERYVMAGFRNVIDIISFVYKQQIKRNGRVGVVFFEEIHKMPRIVEFLKKHHDTEREESKRFFEDGVKEGLFRGEVDYTLMMEVGRIAMEEIMHRQLYKEHSMQELFDNYFMIIIRGICTQHGLELLNKAIRE